VGASVNYNDGVTSVTGGTIKGLFDPATTPYKTWQAVTQGVSMETNAFLAQAAAISGDAAAQQAFMNATKIPVVQVGMADLKGSRGSGGDYLNVNMNGVTFFAASTAPTAAPKIWATGSITGDYNVTSLSPGTLPSSVNLTGSAYSNASGLNATFTPTRWDTSPTNAKWGAAVSSTGTTNVVNGYNIQFKGGAAGTLSGGTAGTITTGTGAGIVK